MTMLEQPPVERRARARTRVPLSRYVVAAVATLLVTAVVSGLVYRERYAPLDARGSWGTQGLGMQILNDATQVHTVVAVRASPPDSITITLTNRGRFAVTILSIGDPSISTSSMTIRGTRISRPDSLGCCRPADLVSLPAVLASGESRTVVLEVVVPECLPFYADDTSQRASDLQVRFRSLAKTYRRWVDLPVTVQRNCPDVAGP